MMSAGLLSDSEFSGVEPLSWYASEHRAISVGLLSDLSMELITGIEPLRW